MLKITFYHSQYVLAKVINFINAYQIKHSCFNFNFPCIATQKTVLLYVNSESDTKLCTASARCTICEGNISQNIHTTDNTKTPMSIILFASSLVINLPQRHRYLYGH